MHIRLSFNQPYLRNNRGGAACFSYRYLPPTEAGKHKLLKIKAIKECVLNYCPIKKNSLSLQNNYKDKIYAKI